MSYGNNRTTDKYTKVKKASEKAPENEIRIRAVPRIGRYISYAAALLHGDEQKGQKAQDTVVLKASGNATKSACQIAEILRHKVVGLHQENILKTIPVIDEYEPKEEGLDKVVVERKLAVLEIHLSLKDGALNTKAPGYQAPLPKEQVEEGGLKDIIEGKRPADDSRPRQRGGRGRGFRRGRYTGNRGGGRNQGDRRGGDDREDRRDDNRGERRNYDNRDNRDRGERRNYDNRDNRDNRENRGERRNYDNRDNRDNRGERRDNRRDDNNRGERRNYDNRRDDNRGERRNNNTNQKRNN